ncbi:hypothetical protein [Rubritalea marina]|uniref:hypothetical protein n=1 Tax=Rubritalea marina TaxID=361055 RepID=UPI00037A77C5|nr:hypothetical protein [Rubritalea marina]
MTWNDNFLKLFRRCIEAFRSGNMDFESYYSEDDLAFLESIGYKPRELFDFVEDLADAGEPTESTALLIAAVRRDYLNVMQSGVLSEHEISPSDLPAKNEEFDGIRYLPRIIAKAEHKLRGELDPDIMYSCGGDRNFLRKHGNLHPADFLRHVWAADGDIQQIAKLIKSQSA